MTVLVVMILTACVVCGLALVVLLWALRAGQFDDPAGDAARIVTAPDRPI